MSRPIAEIEAELAAAKAAEAKKAAEAAVADEAKAVTARSKDSLAKEIADNQDAVKHLQAKIAARQVHIKKLTEQHAAIK